MCKAGESGSHCNPKDHSGIVVQTAVSTQFSSTTFTNRKELAEDHGGGRRKCKVKD